MFEAFKQVEVAVREAARFGPQELGVRMVREAFHPESGSLTDHDVTKAEQQAMSDLFAGALGSFKNPHSHRDVEISDASAALEMIAFASCLLRIVESRNSAGAGGQPGSARAQQRSAARRRERTAADSVPETLLVGFDYPEKIGLIKALEGRGYKLQWCREDDLALKLRHEGWQLAYEVSDEGKRFVLKMKDRPFDQVFIMKKTA